MARFVFFVTLKLNKITIFALYTLIVACIGIATIVEKYHGTSFVSEHIYGAWWFSVLWGVLTVASLAYIMKQRLYKRVAVFLLHASFVVILAGALTTHLTARRGTVRLRIGIPEKVYVDNDRRVEHLPFTLTLKEFRIINYPGTDAPLDYQSVIQLLQSTVVETPSDEILVSMNHIGYIDGYRLFQQSYDNDGEGVTLGLSYDPYGIAITYVGYLLLLFGIIATLFSRKTQMRTLYRKAMMMALLLVSITWYSPGGQVLPREIPVKEQFFIKQSMDFLTEAIVTGQHDRALEIVAKIKLFQRDMIGDVLPTENKTQAELFYNKLRSIKFPVLITLQLGLRWWLSGHIPLSNGYETMLFMAWILLVLTIVLFRQVRIILVIGPLAALCCLLVAMMTGSGSEITPLMPVLQSPLLSLHVMTVMCAYALFALQMMLGIYAFLLNKKKKAAVLERTTALSQFLLYPAVFLLTIGIFLGAVWANVSWGNYWSWDPKESWALITLMVYAVPLHRSSLTALRAPLRYHTYIVVAFLAVIITYFGVNYLLGGMHSYA